MKILAYFLFAIGMVAASPSQSEDNPHTTGNVPIFFYGKVIDQNNQPVAGVKIEALILQGYEKSPAEYKQKVQTNLLSTDASGNFVLENVKGSSIQLNFITKDGFKLLPKHEKRSYLYWPPDFHPDVNNPVFFKMWKKQGAEPLENSAWHGRVACDGTTNRFDLLSGKKNPGGNLEIVCKRVPLQLPPRNNDHFDYELDLTIAGGGIQSSEDDFSFIAPESGYAPCLKIGEKAKDKNWSGKAKQEFYIKTSNGNYGRLNVDWYNWQTSPTHLEWNCSINPSGSRNLER